MRLLTQPALSTAPGVGPGTYRVDDGRRHAGGEVSALVVILDYIVEFRQYSCIS